MFERLVSPAAEVVRAALRPETVPGHIRELTSLGVTAAMWPLGLADKGIAELRRRVTGDESPIETPVLLVHGYGANKSNWLYLERYLRDAGFRRVHALNYNPLTADIPALATACTRRARELMDHFGVDRIHVIGHSLGGVVARYAVQISGLEGVDTLVTVASPHRGAPLAHIGFGATAAQLCPGSPVLRRLRASSRPLPTTFVAYYSNLDLIVPARRAMILEPALRATNILVKDEGHLSILLSRRLAASVVDQLGAAEGLPGYGTRLAPLVPAPPVAVTGDGRVAAAG
jgi:pimeloyl-ACP methyl ester carboxylesterase